MAKSTRQYVFEGMEVLPEALVPFVEKRLESALSGHWQVRVAEKLRVQAGPNGDIAWDQAALLNAMDRYWADAFKTVLGRAERSIVNELVAVRNKLSHNETFTYDDAERALDSMRRLLEAIGAGAPAERLGKKRDTILRTRFAELRRNEERPSSRSPVAMTRKVRRSLGWADREVSSWCTNAVRSASGAGPVGGRQTAEEPALSRRQRLSRSLRGRPTG